MSYKWGWRGEVIWMRGGKGVLSSLEASFVAHLDEWCPNVDSLEAAVAVNTLVKKLVKQALKCWVHPGISFPC
jgi:hypothetical protein